MEGKIKKVSYTTYEAKILKGEWEEMNINGVLHLIRVNGKKIIVVEVE